MNSTPTKLGSIRVMTMILVVLQLAWLPVVFSKPKGCAPNYQTPPFLPTDRMSCFSPPPPPPWSHNIATSEV